MDYGGSRIIAFRVDKAKEGGEASVNPMGGGRGGLRNWIECEWNSVGNF